MNNISSKTETMANNNIRSTKPAESVETAGSLASSQPQSLFKTNVYDVFSSSNPFSVDYTQYASSGETVAFGGGFLSSFSSAVSTLTSAGSSFTGGTATASAGTASCGGGFSGGSCGSSGGFSSVC